MFVYITYSRHLLLAYDLVHQRQWGGLLQHPLLPKRCIFRESFDSLQESFTGGFVYYVRRV